VCIDDTLHPVSEEKSTQLINYVRDKINEQETKKKQSKSDESVAQSKHFEDEKLVKLKEMAEEVEKEASSISIKAEGYVHPNEIKQLQDLRNDLQKYNRGTNANKISVTLKQIFGIMENIELKMIEQNKEEEISVIKNSMVSDVDILNEYNKRKKADQIKSVGEKSADSEDKYYMFMGRAGMYKKFIQKDFFHKLAKGNYRTENAVRVLHYISVCVPLLL
jgi:hypothetical protein